MIKLGEMRHSFSNERHLPIRPVSSVLPKAALSWRLARFTLLAGVVAMLPSVICHASEEFDRSVTPAVPAVKKLIKSGWDSPSPEYTRDHIREMEAASPCRPLLAIYGSVGGGVIQD